MQKTMPAYLNSINSRNTEMLDNFGQDYIIFRKFYKLVSSFSEKFDSIRCIKQSNEQMEISIILKQRDQKLINHIQKHLNDGIEYEEDRLTIKLKVLR